MGCGEGWGVGLVGVEEGVLKILIVCGIAAPRLSKIIYFL